MKFSRKESEFEKLALGDCNVLVGKNICYAYNETTNMDFLETLLSCQYVLYYANSL